MYGRYGVDSLGKFLVVLAFITIIFGNIFESDIRTILSSDRANAIKDGFQNKTAVEDLCLRCPYARRFKV